MREGERGEGEREKKGKEGEKGMEERKGITRGKGREEGEERFYNGELLLHVILITGNWCKTVKVKTNSYET